MIDPAAEELILDRFRRWLHEARVEAETSGPAADVPDLGAGEGGPIGLYQLIEEFTALRHELKLQTKSTRGLQDQAETLLPALRQAIDLFRAVEPKEAQAARSASQPLAEALADLDEALERGRLEFEKVRRPLFDDPARATEAALDALLASQPWTRRWLLRSYHALVQAVVREQGQQVQLGIFDSLIEGFGLIQSRLQRTLKAEQIWRIDCVGQPVDPDRMTVIAVVDDPERPSGEVVEEVRRGYTWKGRVLRLAEVRANRLRMGDDGQETVDEES